MTFAPPLATKRETTDRASCPRLAVVLSHPIQYYAPWFRQIVESGDLNLRVFYLWNPDTTGNLDRTFGKKVKWDIPLLEGYPAEFVENVSSDPGTHHFNGLNNPGLTARIKSWSPDAILLFGYAWKSHLRVLLSPSLKDIPILFRGDSHELNGSSGMRAFLSTFARRLLFRRVSSFLSVGSAHDGYLKAAGVPDRKITRCAHAIDNDRFREARPAAGSASRTWKQELGIDPARPVALFAGKFENKKRPQDLLDAFLSLDPDTFLRRPALLFVGNGVLESELRHLAGERLGKDVFFAPFQNQTLMPRTYASGDFLVLPSQGRGETWGLAVNECMNLGRPAIVSTHVGCGPDLIEEGTTGWRFPAGDQEALAAALTGAFQDPEKTRQMGAAAASKVARFSYANATRSLVNSLKKIASKNGA